MENTMATRNEIIQHNLAEPGRVCREGGHGWLLLPGSRPGTVTGVKIDQDDAEGLLARYCELLTTDITIWERGRGRPTANRLPFIGNTKAHGTITRLWRELRASGAIRLLPWTAELSNQTYGELIGLGTDIAALLIIDYVCDTATLALADGATAEQLAERSEWLAEKAQALMAAHGLSTLLGDVDETLCAMTRFGPLTDWLLPDDVERLKLARQDAAIRSMRWIGRKMRRRPVFLNLPIIVQQLSDAGEASKKQGRKKTK
ncbi:MAG TPA: hypothetical protein VHC00_00475 [Rhizobiaceae bacterium]|nr:hypothetical protein [Rhizobiaceae bacterium]